MVAQPAGPSRPPSSIEDFLWNLHTVLVASPPDLGVETLKDAYSKHCGHKCAIERWLVVGGGGLAATFKRIPHIVLMYQANGTTCIKTALPNNATKETLVEADQAFRRELQKKNLAAKSAKAGGAAAAPAAEAVPSKAAPPAAAAPTKAVNGPDIALKSGGPTRPPATIEDFLFNVHCVLEAYGGPMLIDDLKEAYSKHLGHKCAIERFLVVGDGGLAGTLKRIPHVVDVTNPDGPNATVAPVLPKGATLETLRQADQDYRKTLQQKNLAAKAAVKAGAPAASAKPPPPVPPAATGQTRPAEGGSEPDAKKQKTGDADTLSRMLVQGVVRVLQHRAKEGKGPLLVSELPEEFKALWKVPFNLQSAGYSDVNTFLQAWPNKVELTSGGSGDIVALVKKSAEKPQGAPEAKAPAAEPAAPPKKAAPPVPVLAETAAPAPAAAPASAASEPAADGEPDTKKAKTADMETLSKMLVQGVVRVLQSRAKEGKDELLVSNLAEEFKTLWKVPFNLSSAGYTDVNNFLKAWPNKIEVTSSPSGDIVSLAKKGAEKAKAEPAKPAVTAAKATSDAEAVQPKFAIPSPPKAAALVPAKPAAATAEVANAGPIPSTAAEIRKELVQNTEDMGNLAARQRALVEALNRMA